MTTPEVRSRGSLVFSEKEIAYLKSQPLARIGTASKAGRPDVAPVGFDFDGQYFYVSGRDIKNTMKYKNVLENPQVAFVVDDLKTVRPWVPRQVKIHGTADIVQHTGYTGPGIYIRIKPVTKRSWGM